MLSVETESGWERHSGCCYREGETISEHGSWEHILLLSVFYFPLLKRCRKMEHRNCGCSCNVPDLWGNLDLHGDSGVSSSIAPLSTPVLCPCSSSLPSPLLSCGLPGSVSISEPVLGLDFCLLRCMSISKHIDRRHELQIL